MWGSDGKATQPDASQGAAARRPAPAQTGGPHTHPAETVKTGADTDTDEDMRPPWADALEAPPGGEPAALDAAGAAAPDVSNQTWLRLQARRLIREFLRAVPRADAEVALTFIHPDGTPRLVTRGQFSAAIDGMRPRLRQILRLSVEERWPRQKVCDYLSHISIKTFERDQVEGLDQLIDL